MGHGRRGERSRRQVALSEMHRIRLRGQREVEAVVHHQAGAVPASHLTQRSRPIEGLRVSRPLGPELDDRRAAPAARLAHCHWIGAPARVVVRQNVQPAKVVGQRTLLHVRIPRAGSSMPSSTIFLRKVLRLIPRIAAARI